MGGYRRQFLPDSPVIRGHAVVEHQHEEERNPLGFNAPIQIAKKATEPTSRAISGRDTLSITTMFGAKSPEHEPRSVARTAGHAAPRQAAWAAQARRSPSSRSCPGSTGAGAPVSGAAPLAALGNAITSRIDSEPASAATL